MPLVRSSCTLNLAVAQIKSVSEMHSPESDYYTAYTFNYFNIKCMGHGSYLTLKPLDNLSMFILGVYSLFPIQNILQTRSKLLYVQMSRRITLQDNNLSLSTKEPHHNLYSFTMSNFKMPSATKSPNRAPKTFRG